MRTLLATSIAALFVVLPSHAAADEAVFRMRIPTVVLGADDDASHPPGSDTSSAIEIYAPAASGGRVSTSISIPVVIAGATGGEIVTRDGPAGISWIPGDLGNGAISWSSAPEGTHEVTIGIADAAGTPKASKAVTVVVHGPLTASLPKTVYEAATGDALTITPSLQNLIEGKGPARWGTMVEMPSWLSLDDVSGEIAVDTSVANSLDGIVLTAVDQTDHASASTWPFSVAVKDACDIWTPRTAAEANSWQSVTYGNGIFVAVASDGANRVMTSPDGVTWTAGMAAEQNGWYGVTYGNGLFVAVASDGEHRVMTSPDGITWTPRTAAAPSTWHSITYGNGIFVAVATSSTYRVMTSTDGVIWTARTAAEANQWFSVAYGDGLFVAVANTGTYRVMTSTDGSRWDYRTATGTSGGLSVTHGNGKFVAVVGSGTNRVMSSSNGTTWIPGTAAEQNPWYSVTYGNGLFVAVASGGASRVMPLPTAPTGPQERWLTLADGNPSRSAMGVSLPWPPTAPTG